MKPRVSNSLLLDIIDPTTLPASSRNLPASSRYLKSMAQELLDARLEIKNLYDRIAVLRFELNRMENNENT